jgi:hypothetical protein
MHISSRTRAVALCLLAALIFQALPASGWGVEGHEWINRTAARKLPKSMPQFLRKAADQLTYLGPEPDRWRNKVSEPFLKYSQEPDHFINLESIPADFGPLPDSRYDFMQRLYAAHDKAVIAGVPQREAEHLLPNEVGMQPYIVMEVYGRLKVAFREYRHAQAERRSTKFPEADAIHYAGWLGHYVADGAQPLHTTVHYDGWVGPNPNGYRTKKGLHWAYESDFVIKNIKRDDFASLVHDPVQLQHPFADYMSYLRASNAEVPKLYQIEKAGGFTAGSDDAKQFTRERLAAGSQMLLDLWYTAWMESAVEPPDPFAPQPKATAKP